MVMVTTPEQRYRRNAAATGRRGPIGSWVMSNTISGRTSASAADGHQARTCARALPGMPGSRASAASPARARAGREPARADSGCAPMTGRLPPGPSSAIRPPRPGAQSIRCLTNPARAPGAPRIGRLIGRRPRPSGPDSGVGANAYATAFQALPERRRVGRTSSAFRDLASRCEGVLFHFGNTNQSTGNLRSADVLTVALEAFPVPGGDSSCADILDFKAAQQNNRWAFRRFLHDVVSERQTEAEIRDDIEWTINQYTKELGRFQLKRSVTFMETYIIPTVEALESFKPSSFLKGIVSIKKRKIELLEAEARAPGREVAYVFDARRRLGAGQS